MESRTWQAPQSPSQRLSAGRRLPAALPARPAPQGKQPCRPHLVHLLLILQFQVINVGHVLLPLLLRPALPAAAARGLAHSLCRTAAAAAGGLLNGGHLFKAVIVGGRGAGARPGGAVGGDPTLPLVPRLYLALRLLPILLHGCGTPQAGHCREQAGASLP